MNKAVWDEKSTVVVSNSDKLVNQLLSARGFNKEEINEFVNPSYDNHLSDPLCIYDMRKAVGFIYDAIKKDKNIVIYGDYDIDGISASSLLYDYLGKCGAKISLYIPDRFEEGYGLNIGSLKKLKKKGADLVVSVDCGTTAHSQITEAKKIGLDVVVTDHHEPDGKAPLDALACVNPRLGKDEKLSKLAGVGVAFYLVRAMQKKYGFLREGQEKWLLDLVALGTVCDVVPITDDNRVLVKYGLEVMRKTRRAGLNAIFEICGIKKDDINEQDLGFKVGPRLNAAGRLEHAQKALDLLTSEDKSVARTLASYLNNLNITRREITNNVYQEANKFAMKYKKDPVLVLSHKDWPQGIVGIVASRISEKHHKPTIIMEELDDYVKGSARSFNNFNIVEAIRACSDSLIEFGGHSFAAGVKLKPDRVNEFRFRINKYAIENMHPENNFKKIIINIRLKGTSPSLDIYREIRKLAPFGNSNQVPILTNKCTVKDIRYVGSDNSHVKLVVIDEMGIEHDSIAFGMADKLKWLEVGNRIDMAYEISLNAWNDQIKHQLSVVDIKERTN